MTTTPVERLNKHELKPRIIFHSLLGHLLDSFTRLETQWQVTAIDRDQKLLELARFRGHFFQQFEEDSVLLGNDEMLLFLRLFGFFSLKNGLEGKDLVLLEQLSNSSTGLRIGFLGPLGVSKTTAARALASDYNVGLAAVEPHERNPFWKRSQTDPASYEDNMLRSQIYFLLSNLDADIRTRLSQGILISDTSSITDIEMWAEWYHRTYLFDKQEYDSYQRLVNLLMPLFPRPDLLLILIPDTVQNLKQGIVMRQKAEPVRKGELIFADADDQRLLAQCDIVLGLVDTIPKKWQAPILAVTINPVRFYQEGELQRQFVNQIRDLIKKK